MRQFNVHIVYLITVFIFFGTYAVAQNGWVNVKDFGAKGDGRTNDVKVINQVIKELCLSPTITLFFPPGEYVIEGQAINLFGKKIRILGAGRDKSILKGINVATLLSTGKIEDSLIIQNITLDASQVVISALNIDGRNTKGVVVVDQCFFYNAHLYNIWLASANNVYITNNIFRAIGTGTCIQVIYGCHNINIIGNCMYYVFRGVYIIGHLDKEKKMLQPNSNIVFEKNYLDFGWYLLPPRYIGNDGVSYSRNTIIDPKADFKEIVPGNSVRVLKPLISGTLSETNSRKIKDVHADFINQTVKKRDLIRIGDKQAVVDSVIDKHTLLIEKWINIMDLKTTFSPMEKSHYSIYRIIIGKIKSNTNYKISVWGFYDFFGTNYTPEDSWQYEILKNHPDYPFFATINNSKFLIKNNVFRRGWADQIAINGNEAVIFSNYIEDGQDMGITLHGKDHVVYSNTIIYQRTGVWLECHNSTFKKNSIIDCAWATDYSENSINGYLYVRKGSNKIIDNVFKRLNVFYKPSIEAIRINKTDSLKTRIMGNKFQNVKE